jgi:hypothetical protein
VVDRARKDVSIAGALIGAYNLSPGAVLIAQRRTESDGYFEIHCVPPGSYNVGVLAEERVPTILGASATVVDADVTDLLVEVDAGVAVRGRVEPAAAARISSEIDPENFSMLTMMSSVSKMLLHART